MKTPNPQTVEKKVIEYVGRPHYEDCRFILDDWGVCNCPDDLKLPTQDKELLDLLKQMHCMDCERPNDFCTGLDSKDVDQILTLFSSRLQEVKKEVEGLKIDREPLTKEEESDEESRSIQIQFCRGYNQAVDEVNSKIDTLLQKI